MAKPPQQIPVKDPDAVGEIICNGQLNVSIAGEIATITFTHIRPDPGPMFKSGSISDTAVVRARIVTPMSNLIALRDLLNRIIQAPGSPAPSVGGPTKH